MEYSRSLTAIATFRLGSNLVIHLRLLYGEGLHVFGKGFIGFLKLGKFNEDKKKKQRNIHTFTHPVQPLSLLILTASRWSDQHPDEQAPFRQCSGSKVLLQTSLFLHCLLFLTNTSKPKAK